jgi:hypothetical protein
LAAGDAVAVEYLGDCVAVDAEPVCQFTHLGVRLVLPDQVVDLVGIQPTLSLFAGSRIDFRGAFRDNSE